MTLASEEALVQRAGAVRLALEELATWLAGPSVLSVRDSDREQMRSSLDKLFITLDKIEAEPSLLTVVLLGGTGVGKSTILNALAGARIAPSSLARPTTQFPTVYHHRDVDIACLPEPFQACRHVSHDRPELRHKILVDTPDIDGSVVEHHQRLARILPVADTILYVGSVEKYHDRAAWKLLLEHAPTRSFAFILNKWDRCLAAKNEATGASPDEDLRASLRQAGFDSPRIFRLMAKQWEALRTQPSSDSPTVEDDFNQLVEWIENELDERAIRDIKARGLAGELDAMIEVIGRFIPADASRRRDRLAALWTETLRDGVSEEADLLIEAASTAAGEFERHFSRLGRQGIGGIFGFYLQTVENVLHLRATLLELPGGKKQSEMSQIVNRCLDAMPQSLRANQREALRDRLLMLADRESWPIAVLGPYLVESEGPYSLNDQSRNEAALANVLTSELLALEKEYSSPEGGRRAIHVLVRGLCQWLPILVLAGIGAVLVNSLFQLELWGVGEFLSAGLLFGMTIALLHFLLVWAFPVRWENLRERLRTRLVDRLLTNISPAYLKALERYAEDAANEARRLKAAQDVLTGARDQLRRSTIDSPSTLFARLVGRRGGVMNASAR